jgi:hypothetical protein
MAQLFLYCNSFASARTATLLLPIRKRVSAAALVSEIAAR